MDRVPPKLSVSWKLNSENDLHYGAHEVARNGGCAVD